MSPSFLFSSTRLFLVQLMLVAVVLQHSTVIANPLVRQLLGQQVKYVEQAGIVIGTKNADTIDASVYTITNENKDGWRIMAKDGDDTIKGSAGSDLILAGDGNDLVKAGQGDDTVIGGAGSDVLYGQRGSDLLVGDLMHSKPGASSSDTLYGGKGPDTLVGDFYYSSGNAGGQLAGDTLVGNRGADTLVGDVYQVRSGTVLGGDDLLKGKGGNDVLAGGALIVAPQAKVSPGNDRIRPGRGRNTIVVNP